jgi:hypothetical protein
MEPASTDLVSCASEGRAFFHDRVGRFFYKPQTMANATVCPRCGADGVRLEKVGKQSACLGYRAIAAKRHGVIEGAPIAFGAPIDTSRKRGHTAFAEQSFALVEEDRSYVACNIAPVAPLPDTMTATRTGEREFRAIIRRLIEQPPTKPFLLVAFSRVAEFPMILSRPGDHVWLCKAPAPVGISLSRLSAALAFHERHKDEIGPLTQLALLRQALAAGDQYAGEKINKILEKFPAFSDLVEILPSPDAPETDIAGALFKAARREAEAAAAA